MHHVESNVKIFFSREYSRFRIINGNRQLNEAKIRRIKRDIEDGLDVLKYCPVLVTERGGVLEIIDGQHRFYVAKELKSQVWYILSEEMSLRDIAKVNSNTERWKDKDFINCYAAQDNEHYIRLRDFMGQWQLPVTTATKLLENGALSNDAGFASNKEQFHAGSFVVKKWEEAQRVMEHVALFENFAGRRTRQFITAVCKILSAGKVSLSDIAEKYRKYPEELRIQGTWKDYLINLEAIYNKGKHSREVIY